MKKSKLKLFILDLIMLLSVVILVSIDQFTKNAAIINLKNQSDFIILPGVLQFHYLENTGAAFSMLEGKQILFAIMTPVLIALLIYIVYKMPKHRKFIPLLIIIIFVISGAIGNYIDRVTNQFVVDFIYFSLINFPVFNVADCYVTVSIIFFFILMIFYYTDEDLELLKDNLRIRKNG